MDDKTFNRNMERYCDKCPQDGCVVRTPGEYKDKSDVPQGQDPYTYRAIAAMESCPRIKI